MNDQMPPPGTSPVAGRERADVPWWGPGLVERTTLLHPFAIVAGRLQLVALVTVGFVVGSVALALLLPHRYVALASFAPERSRTSLPGNLIGLAGQFGLQLDEGAQSPQFYARVLEGRSVLERVLQSGIAAAANVPDESSGTTDPILVMDVLRIRGKTGAERLENGVNRLRRIADVRVEVQTGIVTVAIEQENGAVAAQIANLFLSELNRFNANTRQSTARQEREFLEARVRDALSDLRDAEEQLRVFLERNRRVNDSPELTFQMQRLERQAEFKTQVSQTLQQQLEQARLREVNNTPVVTVIEPASVPVKRSKPRRRRMVIVATVLGLAAGVVAALSAEYVSRARQRGDLDYLTLHRTWSDLRVGTRRLLTGRRPVHDP